MKKTFKISVLWLVFFATVSCGKLNLVSLISGALDEDGDNTLYFFATDFSSSGQLFQATISDSVISAENTGMTSLGSSAILRHFDGKLYLLHDGYSTGSSDNVQIIDPDDSFATLGQFSTGNGTNPHDIVVKDDAAYISLYNPSASGSDTGAIIKMDLDTGSILQNYSFTDFLNADGDLNANADQMVLVDDLLYVCLQDLESTSFDANSSGLLGVIDVDQDSVEGAITLTGRNPVDIVASSGKDRLFVANMALYDEDVADFDLNTSYGGIEVVDLNSSEPALLIDDAELGGYVERLAVSDETVFAVVSQFDSAAFTYLSKIVEFPQDISSSDEVATLVDFEFDIRDIFVQNNFLWISKREVNSSTGVTEAKLAVYDISTGEKLGDDLLLDVAATSLAGE